MDHYQVKFKWGNRTVYGICHDDGKSQFSSPEAKKWAKKGKIIVADAVTTQRYIVEPGRLIDIPLSMDFKDGVEQSEYGLYVEAERKKAEKASGKLKAFAPGKLFSVGVADGTACYVVTQVDHGKKTCEVEWRGFGGADRYTDQVLGWGGTFPIRVIKPLVENREALMEIFS